MFDQFTLADIFAGVGLFAGHNRTRHQFEGILFFRLVNFDVALHAADQRLPRFVNPDRFVRDFAQRDDWILVVIAVHCQRRARRNIAAAMRRQHNKIESVGDLLNAIFYCNTSHD